MSIAMMYAAIAELFRCAECERPEGSYHHADCSLYPQIVRRPFAYLSSVTMPRHWPAMAAARIGIMLTPASGARHGAIDALPYWAADNGCYSQGEEFSLERFFAWLKALRSHRRRALFAVAPDVVGDAAATWARSRPVLPAIRRLGYPAAFVAQDGLENEPVPWSEFDVLFVGGTTKWKLSEHAFALVREARERGKRTHMGRVNSYIRLRAAVAGGYDSADGTHSSFGPDKRIPQLCRWLEAIRKQPGLRAREFPEVPHA